MLHFQERLNQLKTTIKGKYIQCFYKKWLHTAWFVLLVITIFTLLFILNRITPWIADDFCKGQMVLSFRSFSDWFNNIYNFYFSWGGRIWGELFALISLAIPKSLYNILNTLVYMIVVLLIYFNILGKQKISVSLLLGINFSLFAFLPAFGQDILWISGSANYLWSSLTPLAFLVCWRLYYQQPYQIFSNPIFISAIAILGLFAGWMNENVSIAILFLQICFLLYYKMRDNKIPAFATVGIVCTFIGMLFLNLAPGNFARFALFEPRSVGSFIEDAIRNSIALAETAPVLLILLIGFLIKGKSKNKILSCIYASTSFVTCIAFTAVAHIGGRVMFMPIVLLIIAVGILYEDEFADIDVMDRVFRIITATIFVIAMASLFSNARTAIEDYNVQWQENVRIIEASKTEGNLDVIVNSNVPKNKFCAAYGLDDIKKADEIHHWVNDGVARYFKIHTIHSAHINK